MDDTVIVQRWDYDLPNEAPTTRAQRSVKKTAAELKGINKIQQLNKKKIDDEQKKEEEEAKHQKDAEKAREKVEENLARAEEEQNVAKNLHSIMNGNDDGIDLIDIDGNKDKDKDEHPPVKKRGGSSNSSTRRHASSKTHKIISPQDNPTQAKPALLILKTAEFMDTYIHPHKRIVLKLAIKLMKEDTFDKFARALASLLSNAQIVDPKFVINPIKQFSKEKDIMAKGDISTNMTKLRIHVLISGNGYTFLKQERFGIRKERSLWGRRKMYATQQYTSL